MSKYKKPKVGFLDHVAGKTGKETNPIDDVLKEAKENPAPQPEPKVEKKKPVITEEEYNKNLDLLVNYAETDPVAFMVTRYIDSEVIKRIFEYAWDGKNIDF